MAHYPIFRNTTFKVFLLNIIIMSTLKYLYTPTVFRKKNPS